MKSPKPFKKRMWACHWPWDDDILICHDRRGAVFASETFEHTKARVIPVLVTEIKRKKKGEEMKTKRNKMKPIMLKKGDWVAFPVTSFSADHAHIRELDRVKLPASPAVLAKSHRLLMRYYATCAGSSYSDGAVAWEAIRAHCDRVIRAKKGKKS